MRATDEIGLDIFQRLRSNDRFVVVVEIFKRLRPAREIFLPIRDSAVFVRPRARVDFLILVASAASAARELTEHITHHRARLFRARPARGRALTSIVRRRLPPVGRVLHLRQRVVQIILRKRLRRRLARARRAFEPKRVQPDLRARALHPRAHVREDSFALVVVVVVVVFVVVVVVVFVFVVVVVVVVIVFVVVHSRRVLRTLSALY